MQRKLIIEDLDKERAWTTATEPVVSFMLDDGRVLGFPFFHLVVAECDPDQDSLMLSFSPGNVIIKGGAALAFYKDFAKGKGTWVAADGADILSVTFLARKATE